MLALQSTLWRWSHPSPAQQVTGREAGPESGQELGHCSPHWPHSLMKIIQEILMAPSQSQDLPFLPREEATKGLEVGWTFSLPIGKAETQGERASSINVYWLELNALFTLHMPCSSIAWRVSPISKGRIWISMFRFSFWAKKPYFSSLDRTEKIMPWELLGRQQTSQLGTSEWKGKDN